MRWVGQSVSQSSRKSIGLAVTIWYCICFTSPTRSKWKFSASFSFTKYDCSFFPSRVGDEYLVCTTICVHVTCVTCHTCYEIQQQSCRSRSSGHTDLFPVVETRRLGTRYLVRYQSTWLRRYDIASQTCDMIRVAGSETHNSIRLGFETKNVSKKRDDVMNSSIK